MTARPTDHFEQKLTLTRGVYDETDRLPDHFFDVGRRGVISVGPPADGLLSFSDEVRTAIQALAGRLGWPVLAELHSSLRESEQYILEYPDLTTRLLGDSLHENRPRVSCISVSSLRPRTFKGSFVRHKTLCMLIRDQVYAFRSTAIYRLIEPHLSLS